MRPETSPVDISKGLDLFYSKTSIISSPPETLRIDFSEFDAITATTRRLVVPTRTALRGRDRRGAPERLAESVKNQPIVGAIDLINGIDTSPINYPSQEDDEVAISNSAKKGLQSKVDYSSVKLKKRELKSPYPKLMLIRVRGDKNIDVRLVAPKCASVHASAVFVLVTPMQLFVCHGKYSNLLERSTATKIVTSICEKNELGCNAKYFENVHEGAGVRAFWRLLGLNEKECGAAVTEKLVPESLPHRDEPFENIAAEVNTIYKVDECCHVQRISSGEAPKFSLLNPENSLIFDFGSEIYVWVGRNANRAATQHAVAYAEALRFKPLVSGLDQLIFGDHFDVTRPAWCLLLKRAQGVDDSLFQHKFHIWQENTRHTHTTFEQRKVSTSPTSVISVEEDAFNLGRNLASKPMEEPVWILEETKLYRNSKNVFTENVRYFILEGEKTLNEIDELWILRDDRCYIVKWEYRIERTGVRKLDGTECEKETGRPRTAYFYWLGKKTTKREQGLCALALRDYDRTYSPHVRIAQGQESPLFLQLFQGFLTICGYGSNIFVVYGSSVPSEFYMEELTLPVIYRTHAVYIELIDGKITILEGVGSSESSKIAAMNFAKRIKMHYSTFTFKQYTSEPTIEHCYLTGKGNYSVIEADHWVKPPRLFRLFERNVEELVCANPDPSLPFTFQQDSFRDTIMVDQSNKLWLWSDKTISTFALRVANAYWSGRSGPKAVICKTKEPDSFKALFAQWDNFADEIDENEPIEQSPLQCQQTDLNELLRLRTKTWPLEKVISRDLPCGIDLNRLEQYLNDDDFQSAFRMERKTFYALPQWKQIALRKKHKLF